MPALRVLVVDDEPLIRLGIRRALEAVPDLVVAGECGKGPEAVAALASGSHDLVMLDVQCRAAPAWTWCAPSGRPACRRCSF